MKWFSGNFSMNLRHIGLLLARPLIVSIILAAAFANANAQTTATTTSVWLDQGWTDQDRTQAHQLDVGTEIMPWRWFFALEADSSKNKFSANLERFGFIAGANGLPVGVTQREDDITSGLYNGERQWVGVNCTACHTGQLEFAGHKVLIDGSQSLFRLQEFERSLIASVTVTLQDQDKFDRFAAALSASSLWDSLKLRVALQLFKDEFTTLHNQSREYFDSQNRNVGYGPGRLDGLGSASNSFSCHLTDRMGNSLTAAPLVTDSRNCKTSNPPVSIPHLWGMTNELFAQWNNDVHDSLARNVGAIMAGYAKNWVEFSLTEGIKFKTTANIPNIVQFEALYKKLKTPRWQELVDKGLVKALDLEHVAKGKEIYNAKCLSCHSVQPDATTPNSFGNSYWKPQTIPASIVGTENNYLLAENQRRAIVPGVLAPFFRQVFGENIIAADNTVPVSIYRGLVVGATLKNYIEANQVSATQLNTMSNCRDSNLQQTTLGFKARSLEGVIWTAPYLHNGSVPTLVDLLKPASARPQTFYVGCNQYDIEKFGFICNENSPNVFLYDTTLEGNKNTGHEYGTDLSDVQKSDLIVYLQSLEQPNSPSPQNPTCN